MKIPRTVMISTMFVVLALLHEGVSQNCSENCVCTGELMVCHAVMPQTSPDYVNEIVLSEFPPSKLLDGMFCNVSWDNVNKLAIRYSGLENGTWENHTWIYVDNDAFQCLQQIEVFRLNISRLHDFEKTTFYGLENVEELDLSGCTRLDASALDRMMFLNSSFPNLSKLILIETGVNNEGIDISQDLHDNLVKRNLSEINASFTAVTIFNVNVEGICESLKILNISYSKIDIKSHYNLIRPCSALKEIDASGVILPRLQPLRKKEFVIHNMSIPYFPWCMPVLVNLERIYLNHLPVMDETSFYFYNVSITAYCKTSLKEVHLSGYSVPWFDVEARDPFLQLEYLDISNNNVETVGSRAFKHLKYLVKLDASNNRLSKTKSFDETFSKLFQTNTKLEEIYIGGNSFNHLPAATFSSNSRVKRIDLSRNLLKQLSLNISNLLQLEALNLSYNSIQYLDQSSRDSLDKLYKSQVLQMNTTRNDSTMLIDLRGNPLFCNCKSLLFIQWVIQSPFFSSTRHFYHCSVNGQEIPMNGLALQAATEDCERIIRKRRNLLLSTIIPSVVSATVIITIIVFVIRRKRRLYYQRLDNQIDLLHKDLIGFRFPVFLSYCSEDSDFVDQNVFQPLQAHLQAIADTDRDLVCVGDKYFRLGRSIFSEIIQCLENSAVIVVVLSGSYCRSDYCKLEIEHARLMNKRIVILMKEEVDEEEMNAVTREIFKHFTRIRLDLDKERPELQRDWEDICESIIQLFVHVAWGKMP